MIYQDLEPSMGERLWGHPLRLSQALKEAIQDYLAKRPNALLQNSYYGGLTNIAIGEALVKIYGDDVFRNPSKAQLDAMKLEKIPFMLSFGDVVIPFDEVPDKENKPAPQIDAEEYAIHKKVNIPNAKAIAMSLFSGKDRLDLSQPRLEDTKATLDKRLSVALESDATWYELRENYPIVKIENGVARVVVSPKY